MSSTSARRIVHLHSHAPAPAGQRGGAAGALAARRRAMGEALDRLCLEAPNVEAAADAMIACLRRGGRVLVAGNGGSAAEAQHLATELVGRFLREREPYAVLALTADTAILTAIANDYGYEQVFARQVGAYGRPGDVLVGFSTSGESTNLLYAAEAAHERGLTVVAITGARTNRLARAADVAVRVPSRETPVIQELQTIVLHVLCDLVERALAADGGPGAP